MFISGPHKMAACTWSQRKVFCRVFLALVVLGLVTQFAQPGRVHAGVSANGFEIVICSGDGAITITVDSEGNPIEAPGDATCDCGCAACPSSAGVCLIPKASVLDILKSLAAVVPYTWKSTNRALERGRLPVPRGPPTEKET